MNNNALFKLLGINQPVEVTRPAARPALAPHPGHQAVLPVRYPPMHVTVQLGRARKQAEGEALQVGQTFVYSLTCGVEPGPLLTNILNKLEFHAPAYGLSVIGINNLDITFGLMPHFPRLTR